MVSSRRGGSMTLLHCYMFVHFNDFPFTIHSICMIMIDHHVHWHCSWFAFGVNSWVFMYMYMYKLKLNTWFGTQKGRLTCASAEWVRTTCSTSGRSVEPCHSIERDLGGLPELFTSSHFLKTSDFIKKINTILISEVVLNKSSFKMFKGVLHLWALFLKTLCIFSKYKATSDKVSYGSGQKCSKELENYSFTSVQTIVVKL